MAQGLRPGSPWVAMLLGLGVWCTHACRCVTECLSACARVCVSSMAATWLSPRPAPASAPARQSPGAGRKHPSAGGSLSLAAAFAGRSHVHDRCSSGPSPPSRRHTGWSLTCFPNRALHRSQETQGHFLCRCSEHMGVAKARQGTRPALYFRNSPNTRRQHLLFVKTCTSVFIRIHVSL